MKPVSFTCADARVAIRCFETASDIFIMHTNVFETNTYTRQMLDFAYKPEFLIIIIIQIKQGKYDPPNVDTVAFSISCCSNSIRIQSLCFGFISKRLITIINHISHFDQGSCMVASCFLHASNLLPIRSLRNKHQHIVVVVRAIIIVISTCKIINKLFCHLK